MAESKTARASAVRTIKEVHVETTEEAIKAIRDNRAGGLFIGDMSRVDKLLLAHDILKSEAAYANGLKATNENLEGMIVRLQDEIHKLASQLKTATDFAVEEVLKKEPTAREAMKAALPTVKSLFMSKGFLKVMEDAGYVVNLPELERSFADNGLPYKITRVHDELIFEELDPQAAQATHFAIAPEEVPTELTVVMAEVDNSERPGDHEVGGEA